MHPCSLQEVMRAHGAQFAASRALHPRESRALWSIANCYGPALGSHVLRCPRGHVQIEQPHACGHRSCPRCAAAARQRWLASELQRLLPCPHFHAVFTLPHVLLPLWEFNREALIGLLFDAVRGSLLELLADPRHLGALPGITMALHTWGRNLSHHPHVHALVSAGGLGADGRWHATRQAWLLPLKPLQRLYAGKLLAGLRALLDAQQLRLPPRHPLPHWQHVIRALYRAHWNVQLNPPYAQGRSVALYLARYVRGGPLPASRGLAMDEHGVAFEYRPTRAQRRKTLRLAPHEFIARIVWHAPPAGVHTVRHAGLYASAARAQHHRAGLALALPQAPTSCTVAADASPLPTPRCPVCALPLQRSAAPRPVPQNRLHLSIRGPHRPSPPTTVAHPGPTLRSNGRARARARPPLTEGAQFRSRAAGLWPLHAA